MRLRSVLAILCLSLSLGALGCTDADDDDPGMGPDDSGGGSNDADTVPDDAPAPPDGQPTVSDWVVFSRRASDAGFDLYKVNIDGSGLEALTEGRVGDELFASVSHDGAQVVFGGGKPGNPILHDVHVIDVASKEVTARGTGLFHATNPQFSPVDGRIVFEGRAAEAKKGDIYLLPESGEPVQLTTDAEIDAGPVWAPDGQTIYFVSKRSGKYEVWSMAADGSSQTKVTDGTNLLGKPAVSPNGAYLIYAKATASQESRLYLRKLADGTETAVADRYLSEASFASDGRVIAAVAGDGYDIVLIDPSTGSELEKLTTGAPLDGAPAFAP